MLGLKLIQIFPDPRQDIGKWNLPFEVECRGFQVFRLK
jgi:hypothetical protein